MSAVVLVIASGLILLGGYLFYGRFLAKHLGLEPDRQTPAHQLRDDIDYVPTRAPVLLGHHFASIAGAGPIVGPIFAALFGWVPVLLWILIGGVFIGAMHDFSSLIASIRHQGRSIGEVIENHIGRRGKYLFLVFSWSTLILVIAVFTIIVAQTFVKVPASATSSLLFMILAVLFGAGVYRRGVALLPASILGVILLFGCVALGQIFPLQLPYNVWVFILLGYIFVASTIPVWLLLQPRDYLNSFLLYALMLVALLGIFIAAPRLQGDAFSSFHVENLGYLFPVLFVTVACGAISGFHSLVASGTTAKQLNRENDARVVGYGGMLIESLLAVVALVSAAILLQEDFSAKLRSAGPIAVFSSGVGGLMTKLGIPFSVGESFVALAVSAFALTSLDTATRLARFALQELFKTEERGTLSAVLHRNRFLATGVTVAIAAVLVFSGEGMALWPIFGSANQLLAALALLAVSVWLLKRGKRARFALIPMFFMFAVTLTALGQLVWQNWLKGDWILTVSGMLLFALAVILALEGYQSVRGERLLPKDARQVS
jgi:carbon starvation protein